MTNYWTEKKVEKLTKFWEKGISAREIAEKLGGVSRNAVIGKANRLGLSKKEKTSPKVENISELSLLIPKMKGCKWPIGHPGDEDFYFCGKKVVPGKPYCNEHCLIAYRRKETTHSAKKLFKLRKDSQNI